MAGPAFRAWGDDRSASLERYVQALGANDVCVIHLNNDPAARYIHRAAFPARVVLVHHGRGTGTLDDHVNAADRIVLLRRDAESRLVDEWQLPADRVRRATPSVDLELFARPASATPNMEGGRPALGYIGRLEESKGILELPKLLGHPGIAASISRIDVVGPSSADQLRAVMALVPEQARRQFCYLGELPSERLAERMRDWRLLLVPSFSEGSPIVVAEALACGLEVVAVRGVLGVELEEMPGVNTTDRPAFAQTVAEIVARPLGAVAPWPVGHQQAAAWWDDLLLDLGPTVASARMPFVDRTRWLRLRPRPLRKARARLIKFRAHDKG
jgi:glycosyltransferase involved in cell wall biosynthesis